MPKGKSDPNTSILEYALRHLEQEREDIQTKIDHVRRQLGASVSAPAASAPATATDSAAGSGRKKRVLSPAARKRIALAQKRRWAEHRKAKAKAA